MGMAAVQPFTVPLATLAVGASGAVADVDAGFEVSGLFDSLDYLVAGTFFIVLAQIFREAANLREENRLTV